MGNKQAKTGNTVSTELPDTELGFLKGYTGFTEREIREWHTNFIRDCPSGKLDQKKFVEVYQQLYPNGKADNYCKYAFATFDSNNDGEITFHEFLLSLSASSKGNLDDRLEFAFDLYDVSNDQQIDQKELTDVLTAVYDLVGETNRTGDRDPKKRAAEILAKLDASGDKKLSKAEFIKGLKNDPVVCQLLTANV